MSEIIIKAILSILIISGLGFVVIYLIIGTSGNLDYVKANSTEIFYNSGYEITGYEGYQLGMLGFNSYGGAKVWYILKKIEDNGITYQAFLFRWGKEIHIYRLKAVDAIKP